MERLVEPLNVTLPLTESGAVTVLAAAALAALPELAVDGPVVLIVTGRNIDDDLLQRCVDAPESFPD